MTDQTRIAGDLRLIPLADLTLSPLNSRQAIPEEEVEAMAESIAIAGLLQNLIAIETDGRIEVVGGGKRLRALQKLAAEGWSRYPASQKKIDPVPVKVTDDVHRAIAWSGAENTARSELHPADEVRAHAAMRERGSSTSMIARSFAVSERHVERRLRLADLPSPVLDALRANEITYEVAKVLTLAPTEARCLEALASARGRDVRPDTLRRELTPDTVPLTDRRVAFVTLEAYVAAGGTYERDLFADSAYLHDEALLNRLFREKGEAEADRFRLEEGWKWALWSPESYAPWQMTQTMERLRLEPGDLTEADAQTYDELCERAEAGDLDDADLERLRELEDRLQGDFTDQDRESGGVIVFWTSNGLQIERAYRRREDRPESEEEAGGGGTATSGSAAEPKGFPQNLKEDLAAIRLHALQASLLSQPELMLDLLAWSLTGGLRSWSRPLGITLEAPRIVPEKTEGFTLSERLTAVDKAAASSLGGDSRDPTPEAFAAFRALGKKHRNQVLTEALARAFKGQREISPALARDLGTDPRKTWTPTAAGFFGRCPGAYLDSLWRELVPPADGDPDYSTFAGLKKAAKAKRLEALFSDMSVREALGLSRDENERIDTWLPAELQWGDA